NFILFPYIEQLSTFYSSVSNPGFSADGGATKDSKGNFFCNVPLSVFICPSDTSCPGSLTVYKNKEASMMTPPQTVYYAVCNYANNLALFGDYDPIPTPPVTYYTRTPYAMHTVPDGNSNTIAFGERLGLSNPIGTSIWSSTRDLPSETHALQNN